MSGYTVSIPDEYADSDAAMVSERRQLRLVSADSYPPLLVHVYGTSDRDDGLIERVANRFLGYEKAQISLMVPGIVPFLVHSDDLSHYGAHIAKIRTLREFEFTALNFRMRDRAGTWHCIRTRHMALKPNRLGSMTHLVGVAVDVGTPQRPGRLPPSQ
jgi:hypothetical protein